MALLCNPEPISSGEFEIIDSGTLDNGAFKRCTEEIPEVGHIPPVLGLVVLYHRVVLCGLYALT